jgi:glyoxylase-like metal-dependent hydrolase (beta-lactamase superfamily II)
MAALEILKDFFFIERGFTNGNHFVYKSERPILIDTRDDWSTWSRYFHQEAAFFNCTQAMEDGETIAIGPYAFQVIHTPGHASDGIVLYSKKHGVLISSDTLWERDMAVMNIRVEGSAAVLRMPASLDRIEGLDIDIVYPGHGAPFKDMKKAISRSRNRLKDDIAHQEKIGTDLSLFQNVLVCSRSRKANILTTGIH